MSSNVLVVGAGAANEVSSADSAEVFGVFKHTIVLRSNRGILIAFTTKTERHYYSVNVSTLPSWTAGQEISFGPGIIGGLSLLGIENWSCNSIGVQDGRQLSVQDIVNKVKDRPNPGLMSLFINQAEMDVQSQPLLAKARLGLGYLFQGFREGLPSACVQGAQSLAGLGPGLTPAGDDMISGLLAGLYWLSGESGFSPAHQNCADAVVAVAAEYSNQYGAQSVSCAAIGELTESAFALLASADREVSGQDVYRLSRVGYTSGMDTLAGICAAAAILA